MQNITKLITNGTFNKVEFDNNKGFIYLTKYNSNVTQADIQAVLDTVTFSDGEPIYPYMVYKSDSQTVTIG